MFIGKKYLLIIISLLLVMSFAYGCWQEPELGISFEDYFASNPEDYPWQYSVDPAIEAVGFRLFSYNSNIYVPGGLLDDGTGLSSNYMLNLSSERWTTNNSMLYRVYYYQGGLIGDYYYIHGGYSVSEENANFHIINYMAQYDIVNDIWNPIDYTDAPFISHACSCTDGTYLYIIGGLAPNGSILTTNYRYDPSGNEWTEMAPLDIDDGLMDSSCVYNNDKIYFIGGSNGSNSVNNTYIYDIGTDQWTEGEDLVNETSQAATVVFNDEIYLIGGESLNTVVYSTVYSLSLSGDASWQDREENLIFPITRLSAVVTGGRIFVMGGKKNTESEYESPLPFLDKTFIYNQ